MLNIFYAPGKKKISLWRNHDASAFFVSHRYSEDCNMYRGSFIFRIALLCLNYASELSGQLINMAVQASSISPNINARIALSPISSPSPCSAHMMYFGGKVEGDGSHITAGIREQEWYPYYYIQGAEWFNLLSPLVSSRLPALVSEAQKNNHIITAIYPNGVISLRSTKEIDQIDVRDLRDLRTLLYPVLYPGNSKIKFEHLNDPNAFGYLAKPRQQWEYLPILDDEITFDNHAVYFHYKSQ